MARITSAVTPTVASTQATHILFAIAVTIAAAVAGVAPVLAGPLAGAGCDFNNDSFEDLALGVPGETVGSVRNAGAVNVLYGSGAGLTAAGDQLWHQNTAGVLGAAESPDAFGSSVACGDFNFDTFDDLAIGIPGEEVGGHANAGAVQVIFGSATGLRADGNQLWHRESPGFVGAAASGDRLGASLASGDFNDDAVPDLAIGVPGDDVGSVGNAGAVNILYGGGGALTAAGNQLWHRNSASVQGVAGTDDAFGASLAAGDFDNDNVDDLAIGVPQDDVVAGDGSIQWNAGAVNVLNGTAPGGLAADRDELWTQESSGVEGAASEGDQFGYALAAGDFDNDGRHDLAIGVPGEDLEPSARSAGAVNVLYGSASLLTASGDQLWTRDSAGVEGVAASSDAFGASLASADFDNDGRDDLAVGVPGDGTGPDKSGAVNVIYGLNGNGLAPDGDQIWHQDSSNVLGTSQTGDAFGASLTSGDFDGDGFADLAAAAPGETVGGVASAGAATAIYGLNAEGLNSTGNQLWHQEIAGVLGVAEAYDRMGNQPTTSDLLYYLPYATGTTVYVSHDLYSHAPDFRETDMHGVPDDSNQQYAVVAAGAGTIVAIEDSNPAGSADNNYVWIAHSNGEWTKYTHLETGSVTARRFVGEFVTAGTYVGLEGEVGSPGSVHLHFEVAVPDDPANALDNSGFIIGQSRVPLICGIPGNVLLQGQTYPAGLC